MIDLLVENPLFIWKCVTCQLWLGILCIKKKILVDILPQLFNFEVPQLSQRQIWSMITLPGTFHAGLSSLLLLSFLFPLKSNVRIGSDIMPELTKFQWYC